MLSSGIISYASANDYPGLVEVYAKCYYDPDPEAYDAKQWLYMDYFDESLFNQELLDQCSGQEKCKAKISKSAFNVPSDL